MGFGFMNCEGFLSVLGCTLILFYFFPFVEVKVEGVGTNCNVWF
jgi:hypothetical protein